VYVKFAKKVVRMKHKRNITILNAFWTEAKSRLMNYE